MVPHDVPFDERLFESNSLLKQYWETSVNGRSSMASLNVQRRAEEDDHKHQTVEFYNNLVSLTANKESPAPAPEVFESAPLLESAVAPQMPAVAAPIPVPHAKGPIMKPKSVSYGLSVLSLVLVIVIAVLAASVALYYYNGFPSIGFSALAGGEVSAVATEVAKDVIQGGAVQEVVQTAVQAAAPAFAAGRIARFEL